MKTEADTKILQELVSAIAGKNTEAIVSVLKGKKDVNEFKIAEKLEATINQARNILYKLYNEGVASFTRKKDKQKGWYICYWTLNTAKALGRFLDIKKRETENLKHQIASRETKRFFSCPTCHVEFNEETALYHNFICPECGQLLSIVPKEKKIEEMKRSIEKAKEEVALAEQELAKIAEKEAKKVAGEKVKKAKIKKKVTRKTRRKIKRKGKKKVKRKARKAKRLKPKKKPKKAKKKKRKKERKKK